MRSIGSDAKPAGRRSRPIRRAALAWLALWLAACGGLSLRQGWSAALGPVVPHDSFPADCGLCHAGGGWHAIVPDFAFDHGARTGVALHGAHQTAACLLCHNDRGPVAAFAARGCGGCHTDVHRGVLGAACADCHGEQTWAPTGAIARHDRTRFPLAGAHAAAACFRCHPGAQTGNFAGLDPSCHGCHAGDLARTASPDHRAQGWTRDCQQCHGPMAWEPASFQHPASFPLTGGHAAVACSVCHAGSSYSGLSPDCASCHGDDYQRTTDPNHASAGFGTSCQQCHGTTSWYGATFNHSFPITSGKHKGYSCNDCHLDPTSQQQYSCTHCHEHDQTSMDDKHKGKPGYVWSSPACVGCHPTGS